LVHPAHAPQEIHITLFRPPCNLIEPSDGVRLNASLRRIILWVEDIDLDFDGVLSPLHPALSFFSSIGH